jgi:hypothetical protein
VLVVPNVHLDVGYTDYAAKVAEIQSRIVDRAVDLGAADPDFRFTPDGFWPVEEFLRGRTPAQQQRLVEAARRGTVSIPVVYSSQFTGFASLENLARLLYPSKRIAVFRMKNPTSIHLIWTRCDGCSAHSRGPTNCRCTALRRTFQNRFDAGLHRPRINGEPTFTHYEILIRNS